MFLTQVVSYRNAWNTFVEDYPREFAEIQTMIAEITPENIASAQPLREVAYQQDLGVTRFRLDGLWTLLMKTHGWEEVSSPLRGVGSRPIHMRGLGHTKNQVSVALQRHRELVNRWLYTLAPIATRNEIVDVPIGICLLQSTEEALFGRSSISSAILERTKEELIALSPLSHANPFLLFGISLDETPLEIVEIESDNDSPPHQILINRSIEFPQEYHQAGLGILSYFGTVLREKYPDHNCKVRIEQDGLRVRLVIESENGDKEVIEKALQEYELVVRGETPPESFFENKARVLDLKNELRIAQVRIESQRDLIAYQGDEIASLRSLFGHALTSQRAHPLSVCVSPVINVSNSLSSTVSQGFPIIAEHMQSLAALAITEPDIQLRLLDLEESLMAAVSKQTPDEVKESSGFRKLKHFLDEAGSTGSAVNTFLGKLAEGAELLQKVGRRYNDIAEWCGAPVVPRVFLGKDA